MKSAVSLAVALLMALGLAASPALAAGSDSGSSSAKQDPNYVAAKTQIDGGNYAAAVPLLEQVVASDPKNANAYNYLGYSYRKTGNTDAALVNYEKALALVPDHRGANEYLGELYLEMGQLDKAKERLKVLDGACFFGCEEYTDLKEAISAYEAKTGG
jgi:Flp pilus assembly protein TadD